MGRARALADILHTPDRAEYFSVLTKNGKEVRIRIAKDIVSETSVSFKKNATKADVTISNLSTKFSLAGLKADNTASYVPTNSVEKIFRKGHTLVEADIKKNATYLLYTKYAVRIFTLENGFVVASKKMLKTPIYTGFVNGPQGSEFKVGTNFQEVVKTLNINQRLENYFFLINSDYLIENFEVGKNFKDLVLYSDKNKGEEQVVLFDFKYIKGCYVEIGSQKGFVYFDKPFKFVYPYLSTQTIAKSVNVMFAPLNKTGTAYKIATFTVSMGILNPSRYDLDASINFVPSIKSKNMLATRFDMLGRTASNSGSGNGYANIHLKQIRYSTLIESNGKIALGSSSTDGYNKQFTTDNRYEKAVFYEMVNFPSDSERMGFILTNNDYSPNHITYPMFLLDKITKNSWGGSYYTECVYNDKKDFFGSQYVNRYVDKNDKVLPVNQMPLGNKIYNMTTKRFTDGTRLLTEKEEITEERSKTVADFWKSQGYKS